ncbi:MAG TPA: glycoside hydrolase family 43 protein [Pyrinomonadaceae bacterium]|nr:glycoside hydrolase family 43 protein [Pyrinomonadaceae bacterium]
MAADARDAARSKTYINPVHARDFPDPFVLKFAGEYFAYCTGFWRDGRAFGVMRSRDLVAWEELAGALAPLPGEHPCYWAPEVSYRAGKFLMYYSVGNEALMHVRLATAERPEGPFVDSGHRLTREEFAIDPHVFTDREGARYLFYATDFLAHTHVGTGTVVDRMTDDFTLEGRPRPVTRARYDWQVYDPARKEKGGARWHTVEGPFVIERKGRYYEMFSGGNWQNLSYGVSYAVSDRVIRDDEWEQHADGEKVLPVLRTIPGEVVGPGHNSVVRAPDNQPLFCVYHRWADEGRVLAIDRMEFVGDSLIVLGPTNAPQPAPNAPWLSDHFDAPRDGGLGEGWECVPGGAARDAARWSVVGGEARSADAEGLSEARRVEAVGSFVAEVCLRALREGRGAGEVFGVRLLDGSAPLLDVQISPTRRHAVVRRWGGATAAWEALHRVELPRDFDPRVFHQLRFEFDGAFARLTLDDGALEWRGATGSPTAEGEPRHRLALHSADCPAAFKGFALTRGFADDFDAAAASHARGWTFEGPAARPGGEAAGVFEDRRLKLPPLVSARRTTDAPAAGAHEMIVSLKVEGGAARAGRAELWSVSPGAALPSGAALSFRLRGDGEDAYVLACAREGGGGQQLLRLPRGFDPLAFRQFRFRRESGRLSVMCGAEFVGEVDAPASDARVSVDAGAGVAASVDQVRVTAIKN